MRNSFFMGCSGEDYPFKKQKHMSLISLYVLYSLVKLGFEVPAIVFAVDNLVGDQTRTLTVYTANPTLHGRGIDIVIHRCDVSEGAAIGEVYRIGGQQRPCRAAGTLSDDVACGQQRLDSRGFYFAHADGVDVAEDDIGDILGSEVAMVWGPLWKYLCGNPCSVLKTSRTFLGTVLPPHGFSVKE